MFNMPKGPFCQSCGIPMDQVEAGNNTDGSLSDKYCSYCFADGKFVNENITLEEMIDKVCLLLIEKVKMPSFQAKLMTKMFIPNLERWNKQ